MADASLGCKKKKGLKGEKDPNRRLKSLSPSTCGGPTTPRAASAMPTGGTAAPETDVEVGVAAG